MGKYARHLITALICFLLIIALNFILPRLLAGDPVAYLTGFDEQEMSAAQYEYYYNALHLDESVFRQFGYYIKSLFDGTLGYSYKREATVSSIIGEKLGYTLQITLPAVFISLTLGLFWGLACGYKKGSGADKISTVALITINALPAFAIALILVITLSLEGKIFPYIGLSGIDAERGAFGYFSDRIYHLILPVFTVVISTLPSRFLMVRNTAAKFSDDKCVLYAKQRGLSDNKIKFKYIFKNTAQPFITMAGSSIGSCVGGAVVAENVFSINGVGNLLTSAVAALDYPLIQGILFVTVSFIILSVILSDILCILIDPKVRKGGGYEK